MKYKVQIDIDLPVERVVELFDDPDNLKHWLKGLQSFEHLSGEPGQPGSKSKLRFSMGKRETEMIETITVRNLPDEFSGTYEVKGVFNTVRNQFIPVSRSRTKWISEQEFQFSGLMKVISFVMLGMFKKQSMKHLESFKRFAESAENN